MMTRNLDKKNVPTIPVMVQEVDHTKVDLLITISKGDHTIKSVGEEIDQENHAIQGTSMEIHFDVIPVTLLNTLLESVQKTIPPFTVMKTQWKRLKA